MRLKEGRSYIKILKLFYGMKNDHATLNLSFILKVPALFDNHPFNQPFDSLQHL